MFKSYFDYCYLVNLVLTFTAFSLVCNPDLLRHDAHVKRECISQFQLRPATVLASLNVKLEMPIFAD